METVKEMIKKYRHRLRMAAIAVLGAAVLAWTGWYCLPQASDYSERQIVNDDYSLITDSILGSGGVRQKIQVKAGTELYGLNLDFHIYDRVCFGTVYVDLEDGQGNLLASSRADMTSVLDNTFKRFIFDNMVYSRQDSEYTVHIHTSPQSENDKIALWKSRQTYSGFELTENGQSAEGTLALQYITDYVGRDILGLYALVAFLALAGLELVYLLIFVFRAKTEYVFSAAALFIGLIFAFITPVGGAPDEYVHIASAYRISNTMLGVENTGSDSLLTVRECDAVMDLDSPVDYDAFRLADIFRGLGQRYDGNGTAVVSARFADTYKPLYLVQALGITAARLLGLGFIPMIIMGRLANLIFYILAVFAALKLMPVHKTAMALCALLPMGMQLAGSFSYDVFVLALAFLFICMMFRLAYRTEKLGPKQLAAPTAALCLLAPAKTIYILLGALVLILPSAKFRDKKTAAALKAAMIAAALVFWAVWNIGSVIKTVSPRAEIRPSSRPAAAVRTQAEEESAGLVYPYEIYMRQNAEPEPEITPDPDSDILPNGDSRYYYSIPYILRNIRDTVKLVLTTVTTQTGKYLQTMLGTRFGEIIVTDIQASYIWFVALAFLLAVSVVPVKDGPAHIQPAAARALGFVLFLAVVGRTVAACIMWTPINYDSIFGIQGRYFLPALPLALFALEPGFIRLEKNVDGRLIIAACAVDIMIALNFFVIMMKPL